MALFRPHSLPAYRSTAGWSPARLHCCVLATRSTLPFPREKARHYRELEAAVGAVERACRLCINVKRTLLSGDRQILEKDDSTPVTVADFGVQALISLELGRLFPSIPLVAEEDSSSLRSSSVRDLDGLSVGSSLANAVLDAVVSNVSGGSDNFLTSDEVLEAIDRGGKSFSFNDEKPATYWVLDPIDGTRGFLRGDDALYVVGLALVVEGDVAVGIMGCPNWKQDSRSSDWLDKNQVEKSESGIIMVAHKGCGTWTRMLSLASSDIVNTNVDWLRRYVDNISLFNEAKFCIPDSQTWDMIPMSTTLNAVTDAKCREDVDSILLLRICCGSLCKYLTVASGSASVFILRVKQQTLIKAWDHAVGMICVHEAGGQVSDWEGRQLDLEAEVGRRIIYPSGGVLVTNGVLHQDILKITSSIVQ